MRNLLLMIFVGFFLSSCSNKITKKMDRNGPSETEVQEYPKLVIPANLKNPQ